MKRTRGVKMAKSAKDKCDTCALANVCTYEIGDAKVLFCQHYKEQTKTQCPVCNAELVFEYGEATECQ